MEAEKNQLTFSDSLDWYVGEFLIGKRRERTVAEYQKDLEKIFAEIPVKHVADFSLA